MHGTSIVMSKHLEAYLHVTTSLEQSATDLNRVKPLVVGA